MQVKILGICGTHRKQKEKGSSWFLLQETLKAAKEMGQKQKP